MKAVPEVLKANCQLSMEEVYNIMKINEAHFQEITKDMKSVIKHVKGKKIRYKSTKTENKIDETIVTSKEAEPRPSEKKKKRLANSSVLSTKSGEEELNLGGSDRVSQDDSDSSTISSRSRRAAAQAAEQKLAKVPNIKQKLRRPTNFDEKQSEIEIVPPTKTRRTRRHQPAGSTSSSNNNEAQSIQSGADTESNGLKECVVSVESMPSPLVRQCLESKRKSRSLGRTSEKGKRSRDIFNDSNFLSEVQRSLNKDTNLSEKVELETSNERVLAADDLNIPSSSPAPKKKKDSIVLNKELNKTGTFTPIAQSSPVHCNSLDGSEFEGFCSDPEIVNNKVIKIKSAETQPKNAPTDVCLVKKEKVQSESDESPKVDIRSRTKTLRSTVNLVKEEKVRSLSDSSKVNILSQTKTLRSNTVFDVSSEEEECVPRSRTKTIKKAAQPDNNLDQYLASEFKEPAAVVNNNKTATTGTTKGELVKKRVEDFENLKKAEHAKKNPERAESAERTGRLTRNAAARLKEDLQNNKQIRGKTKLPAHCVAKKALRASYVKAKQTPRSAEKENILSNKLLGSASKIPLVRVTPLGPNNRNTPNSDSRIQSIYNAANGLPPGDSTAIIQKQVPDDVLKKKREDERKKRHIKEEEAKKKKEENLKITSEETRRKREEKLQKVAAAREAAEKEKALLAAKAEKEKEQRQRQVAAEKEKQHKEEQMKRKLLMQQKALESEERRKQEEAARLAKLKEQEEEHKRVMAMKEREYEISKQAKTADLRVAESDKAKKIQANNLAKYAAVNNANQKVNTGAKTALNVPALPQSYELTPPREERKPLPPKTENDYGIDDAASDDSSDDESLPKKTIPRWAQHKNRQHLLEVTYHLPSKIWDPFMVNDRHPNPTRLFPNLKKRVRTSSAVWNTPPMFK